MFYTQFACGKFIHASKNCNVRGSKFAIFSLNLIKSVCMYLSNLKNIKRDRVDFDPKALVYGARLAVFYFVPFLFVFVS